MNRRALAPGLILLAMSLDSHPEASVSFLDTPMKPCASALRLIGLSVKMSTFSYQNSMDARNVDRIAIIQILMRLVSILCSWFTDIPLVRKCEELHNLRRSFIGFAGKESHASS